MRFGLGRGARHHRLQTVLAVAAIAAAVALQVVLVSVGGGVSAHELSVIQDSGYQIVVSAAGAHGIGNAHGFAAQILHMPDVAAVSPVLSVAIDLFPSGDTVTPVLAEGVIPEAFSATLGVENGGLFPAPLPLGDPTDTIHYANGTYQGPETRELLVSSPLADALGIHAGATVTLAKTDNRSAGSAFTVTGEFGVPPQLLGPTGAFAVVLPLSDLQVLTGLALGGPTGTTLLDLADSVEVGLVGPDTTNPSIIASIAAQIQADAPYYGVSTLTQQAQQLEAGSAILTGFYLALSSVGLTVGLIFLAIVLIRRVESERRSLGIRRAIGVPGRSIAAEMIARGASLAAAGAVIGVIAGYVVVEALATYGTATVQEATRLARFDPVTLGVIAAGVVALSLLASGAATRAALRTDIAEALR